MKVKLSEVCDVFAGQGAPQGAENYCNFKEGVPFIKAGDLFDLLSGKSECEIQCVNNTVAQKHKLKLYPAGSILFAKSGMSCMKGYVYRTHIPAYVVSHLAVIVPKNVDGEYLKYYLEFNKPNSLIKDSAYPSISLQDISNMELKLVCEEKQKEISNYLSSINRLITYRMQQLSKLDELVKSRFIEMFGDLMENPYGWPVKKISDISLLLKSGLSRKLLNEDIGLPMIRSCNIQDGQFIYDDIKYWYVDDPQGANTEDYILDDGDVLINFINSISQIGKTAIFTDVGRKCIYTTNIFRMKLASDCNKYFYNWYAMTEYYKRQLQNIIQPAVNQASFTTVKFLNLNIPLPPMELQEQFAIFVEHTDKLKSEIKESLEKLETLKKSLMQKYFG